MVRTRVGRDESGPGANAIQANPILVEKLIWHLMAVLQAASEVAVLGVAFDPSGIASDLLSLAKSDNNKALLAPVLPVLVFGLQQRSANKRLVAFSISILSLLTYEPKCKPEFDKVKVDLIATLKANSAQIAEGSKREVAYVLDWLGPNLTQVVRRPSLVNNVPGASGAAKPLPNMPTKKAKHVFLSYCWDNQDIVLAAYKFLRQRELPMWLDKSVSCSIECDEIFFSSS